MRPSNPVSFFVSGSETKEFTYNPGRYLYAVNFSRGNYIAINVIVFANSITHVRRILKSMIMFERGCRRQHPVSEEMREKFIALNTFLDGSLINDKAWTLSIHLADKNQMYRVGWASNDTI